MNTIEQIIRKVKSNDCFEETPANIEDINYFIFEYFNWLDSFIDTYQAFSTDRWLAFPVKVKQFNKDKINQLSKLYELIDNYAKYNSIFSTPFNYGYYYNIKYFDNHYKIGVMFEDCAVYFCSQSNEQNESINITDVSDYAEKEKAKNLVLTYN